MNGQLVTRAERQNAWIIYFRFHFAKDAFFFFLNLLIQFCRKCDEKNFNWIEIVKL